MLVVERKGDLRSLSTGLSYGCKAKQSINGRCLGALAVKQEFRFWGTGPTV